MLRALDCSCFFSSFYLISQLLLPFFSCLPHLTLVHPQPLFLSSCLLRPCASALSLSQLGTHHATLLLAIAICACLARTNKHSARLGIQSRCPALPRSCYNLNLSSLSRSGMCLGPAPALRPPLQLNDSVTSFPSQSIISTSSPCVRLTPFHAIYFPSIDITGCQYRKTRLPWNQQRILAFRFSPFRPLEPSHTSVQRPNSTHQTANTARCPPPRRPAVPIFPLKRALKESLPANATSTLSAPTRNECTKIHYAGTAAARHYSGQRS